MPGSELKRRTHSRPPMEMLNRDHDVSSSQLNAQTSRRPAEVLRLTKDGPDVELDWATGKACENYVVRRSSNAQFSGQVTHDGLQQSAYTDSGAADPLVDRTNYFYLVESANPTPIRWYVRDHRGSTLLALDAQGEVAASYEYYPFGDIKSSTSSCENSGMLYQGSPRDERTGLDDLGARHYSSVLDRFLVPDSVWPGLTRPSNWNLYSYAANDPVNLVDPNGEWPTPIHNEIYKETLPGLSSQQLDALQGGSRNADLRRRRDAAHEHGMRSPVQSPEAAKAKTDQCIMDRQRDASEAQSKVSGSHMPETAEEITNQSLRRFGAAVHPISDQLSPAHRTPDGTPVEWKELRSLATPSGWREMEEHKAAEATITEDQKKAAIEAVREAFREVYGDAALKSAMTPRVPAPQP